MNEKSKIYKIIDNVFQFMFKITFWNLRGKISSLMCPKKNIGHYFDVNACECKRYCHEHERDEMAGCSICEALKLNYKEFPNYILEIYLSRIQHGFPLTEKQIQIEEDYYTMNKNKYFA